MEQDLDKLAYSRWQAVNDIISPIDKVSDYVRFVIKSYLYSRSRLLVPGRTYEDMKDGMYDHGVFAIGNNAHMDIIELDNYLKEHPSDRQELIDWMLDSSHEQVALYRGLGKNSRMSTKRRREKIVNGVTKVVPDSLNTV